MTEIENAEIFAKNLGHYVELSGRSSKDIALEAGVSPSTFSYWLNGKKYPRIDKIEKLAEIFHVQKSDLIEARIISVGVDKMSPEDREKALNMMRVMFAEFYNGSDDDDT